MGESLFPKRFCLAGIARRQARAGIVNYGSKKKAEDAGVLCLILIMDSINYETRIKQLLMLSNWEAHIRKAATSCCSERDDLWGERERIYNNLADDARIDNAREYSLSNQEAILEGTDILWGEYLDYYYLMCKKLSMGDRSFYKEL